ncbi:MAG: SUMF1/EgtB/PvdO family nonheme iron enzyme [Spirochaetaceae bacterium]|nr:SUMF1/EgtB/PvdO family nonheme iron enzyme [Spirochaetaceae bacterium]
MADTYGTDYVKLKPLFGVRPGVWLFGLLCIAFLALLFFLLVFPGLNRNGSLVSCASEPFGAAVLVDGVYRGSTPCDLFISRGTHRFEISLPGFTPRVFERDIPGRVFGSLFFPPRVSVTAGLSAPDRAAVFRRAADEYARWAFGGESAAAWQTPLSLSEGVYRAGSGGIDPVLRETMTGILLESRGYAVTRGALRDFVRAEFLLDNGGNPPSPLSLIRSGRAFLAMAAPGTARHLGGLLDGESAARITESAWYAEDGGGEGRAAPRRGEPAGGRTITLGGLTFVYIDGGTLFAADGPGGGKEIAGFWISRDEVGAAAFDAFLAENPVWSGAAREALVRQNLVTETYLEMYPGGETAGRAGISWHAAAAFTAWLTARLTPGGALEARLPTEAEWEYAARSAELPGGAKIENMTGSLWEWCGDYHVPLAFFAPDGAGQIAAPERNVRGGSWINPSGSVSVGSRASLPPETCSPFVGFRPVIARKAP